MRVTIKDVAKHAAVSVTTVSHVINGTRYVRDETRRRVEEAMEELGYTPNYMAQCLRKGKTKTVGMIIPDTTNPFFAEVAQGVEHTCFENGYSVILSNTNGDMDREKMLSSTLVETQVDGIIFIGSGNSVDHIISLRDGAIPMVVVDRELSSGNHDLVLADHKAGGSLAAEYLIKCGHTRIACITGSSLVLPSSERVVGYCEALSHAGIDPDQQLIVKGDYGFESGYLAGRQLLLMKDRPTAIFACNDVMAIGVMHAANELSISIPGQLSIVGFDDIKMASYTIPPLTTIQQNQYMIGKFVANWLLERIENPDLEYRRKIFPVKLVVRKTTNDY